MRIVIEVCGGRVVNVVGDETDEEVTVLIADYDNIKCGDDGQFGTLDDVGPVAVDEALIRVGAAVAKHSGIVKEEGAP